jgi:curved DNA-binding protein
LNPPDYYEFLQISPNAEGETIHRVYRFLATRLHPDNPETGDVEKFVLLKQAYEVLSNPTFRAEYDAARKKEEPQAVPLSTTIDFMDNMEGELNRRLAVLAVLYIHRRTSPYSPEVSLLEVERRLGFPRDYLEFASWYLRNKGYITRADNSDFTLTVGGVDFVESQRVNIPILNKLLTNGAVPSAADGEAATFLVGPDGKSPSDEIDPNGHDESD